MAVDVMRTIASVGCSIVGSSTLSTRPPRLPAHVTAFTRKLHWVDRRTLRAYPHGAVGNERPEILVGSDTRTSVCRIGGGVASRVLERLAMSHPASTSAA